MIWAKYPVESNVLIYLKIGSLLSFPYTRFLILVNKKLNFCFSVFLELSLIPHPVKSMLDKFELLLICVFLVIAGSELVLGIFEINYVVRSYEYEYTSACIDIRGWIIMGLVIGIFISICTFIGILVFMKKQKNNFLSSNSIYRYNQKNETFIFLVLLQFVQVIMGLWSIVQYVNTDTICYEFLESLNLWFPVFAHSLIMWIYLCAMALFMIIYVLLYACALLGLASGCLRELFHSESSSSNVLCNIRIGLMVLEYFLFDQIY